MSQGKAYEDIVQGEKGFGKPPEKQRVLIFQGGAALGAYEAGAYQVLYNHIRKQLEEDHRDENIFDIVAGTSIGAKCRNYCESCYGDQKTKPYLEYVEMLGRVSRKT